MYVNEGDDGGEERDFKEKEEEESVGGKLGNLSEEAEEETPGL